MSLPNSLFSSVALPKAQFRAVITCGYGSDLYPLIEPVSGISSDEDESKPAGPGHGRGQGQVKALLPVAGKRMLDWVLERVEEAGIYDILVLSPASLAPPIAHHLRLRRSAPSTSSSAHPAAKVELEEVPEDVARRGTVNVVRWAAEESFIKSDFILLPCDLLLSPALTHPVISLASLLDRHRIDDNLMTTLFSERAAGGVVEARKDGPPEVLTIYDRKTSTLLDVREMDEYDDDEVPLRTSLLARFPSPTLSTALLPTQLYIFSSSIVSLLLSPTHARRIKHMENIRELAGFISRLAWRNKGRDALNYRPSAEISREDGIAMGRSTTQLPVGGGASGTAGWHSHEASMPVTGANTPALVSRSSWRSGGAAQNGSVDFGAPWDELGKKQVGGNVGANRVGAGGCKIVVWKAADGWAGRGNTVAGWVEMNRAALKLLPPQPPATNTPTGVFVSPDSFIHPSVYSNMGEKVGVKRCIIGKGCFVGKGTKLTNCVIMEGAHIGENVKLDNCVVSNGVQIRDRASLRDCELGRDVIVEFDATLKGEQLVVELD